MSELNTKIKNARKLPSAPDAERVLFDEVGTAVTRAATTFLYLRASWTEGIQAPGFDG